MKKRLLNSIIAIILACISAFNFVSCSSGFSNNDSNEKPPQMSEKPADSDLSDVYPTIPVSVVSFKSPQFSIEYNEEEVSLPVEEIEGYGVAYKVDKNEGLKSYTVNSSTEVKYDTTADKYNVNDIITVDDEISLEQVYYRKENEQLSLDEIFADYYSVEIDYSETGKVKGIYYMDDDYLYNYDDNDRLISIYRGDSLYKSLEYNSYGKVIEETSGSNTTSYSYTSEGRLYSINGSKVTQPTEEANSVSVGGNTFVFENGKMVAVTGETTAQFEFDYEFNGNHYLTRKVVEEVTTDYFYLGDKIVGLERNDEQISYILDNKFNYVGLKYNDQKYYFAVDPFGNVMGLIDCDGYYVVEYQFDIWGSLVGISGDLGDTLGTLNEIINLSGIYDASLNAYFVDERAYLPESGLILSGEAEKKCSPTKSVYEWEQSTYFARSAVTDFALIHDKVVSVAVDNLKEAGMDVTSNLYATDANGNTKRLVDIYTIDYSITPFSAMNLVNGNQIYEVIYHSPDSMAFETIASEKLKKISQEMFVSYFGGYNFDKDGKPLHVDEDGNPISGYDTSAGTMKFNGQFVYLGYLIDYKCNGNGIVEYQVKINKKSNYNQSVNIYDYDNEKYVCYVNNTFDLNFLDGVTIIPGISQETFDTIDGYLSDQMQAVAGNICDQMLIYDDPAYYNLEEMNLLPDYWAQLNIEEPTNYLEIQADGSVKQKTMPAWETDGFASKLWTGIGVIVATAVVATIALAIPGANCIVVSICVGAAKGAIGGALSGFAFGAISGAAGEFIGQVASGQTIDWSKIANAAASSAADGFATGAITGAIMGGISGGLNPKYCFEAGTPVATANGTVAIENVAVGDNVWSYDYITGERTLKPVTATSVRQTNKILKVEIGGEQIVTTPEHPFYVVNDDKYYGYTAAKYLSVGDCIQTADGGYLEITVIEQQTLDEPITVYNFTVDDNHSYYVGENELLVHNANCGMQNDHVKTAAKNGREMHRNFDYGYDKSLIGKDSPVVKEMYLGSAGRADCVDRASRIVYELKPDNPRAISRGIKQLKRYNDALGGDYTCKLALYSSDGTVRFVEVLSSLLK